MKKKVIIGFLFGIILIYLGVGVYKTGMFIGYYGYLVPLGIFTIPMSVLHFSFGLFLIYKSYRIFIGDEAIIKYAGYKICPKCEESYNSSDLKDDICPNCDIKTVNLEGYFDKK